MREAGAVLSRALLRSATAALLASALASCTSATASGLDVGSPGFANTGPGIATTQTSSISRSEEATASITPAPNASLPGEVGYLPAGKPGAETAAALAAAAEDAAPAEGKTEAAKDLASQETAAEPAKQVSAAADTNGEALPDNKKTFLTSFFGAPKAAAAPLIETSSVKPVIDIDAPAPKPEPAVKAKPLVQLAAADPNEDPLILSSNGKGNYDPLPGVRQTALFEIRRRSGVDDESDVDLHEDSDGPPIQLASAAGLARLDPKGLMIQRESVDVACLKPQLLHILKDVERHFGKRLVVTSGYRSPTYNRQVRGARKSMHMYCAAADVQMPGVSKWDLASYARSMPGRGGVGTYCHTDSIHIDVGPERDWNWRCRRGA